MAEYWRTKPQRLDQPSDPTRPHLDHDHEQPFMSEYDRHRLALLSQSVNEEDWQLELHRYLQDVPADVTRDTNIVDWWSVSHTVLLLISAVTN
jgi:hypothetical protein